MSIGVAIGKDRFEYGSKHFAVGLVLTLALFVLYYSSLFIQFCLVYRAEQVALSRRDKIRPRYSSTESAPVAKNADEPTTEHQH